MCIYVHHSCVGCTTFSIMSSLCICQVLGWTFSAFRFLNKSGNGESKITANLRGCVTVFVMVQRLCSVSFQVVAKSIRKLVVPRAVNHYAFSGNFQRMSRHLGSASDISAALQLKIPIDHGEDNSRLSYSANGKWT